MLYFICFPTPEVSIKLLHVHRSVASFGFHPTPLSARHVGEHRATQGPQSCSSLCRGSQFPTLRKVPGFTVFLLDTVITERQHLSQRLSSLFKDTARQSDTTSTVCSTSLVSAECPVISSSYCDPGCRVFAQRARTRGFKPTCPGVRDKGLGQVYFAFDVRPTSTGPQRMCRSFSSTSLHTSVFTLECHVRIFRGCPFKYRIPVNQKF